MLGEERLDMTADAFFHILDLRWIPRESALDRRYFLHLILYLRRLFQGLQFLNQLDDSDDHFDGLIQFSSPSHQHKHCFDCKRSLILSEEPFIVELDF